MQLTTSILNAARTFSVKTKGRFSDPKCVGLYLRISATGASSWVFMAKVNGKREEIALGSFTGKGSGFSVDRDEAQEKVADLRKVLKAGNSMRVVIKRETAQSKAIFRLALDEVITLSMPKWAESNRAAEAAAWRSIFKTHAEWMLDMSVAAITKEDVLRAVKPVWNSKRTGTNLRARIEAVLGYAMAHGLRNDNPAILPLLKPLLPAKEKVTGAQADHHEAMPHADVPAFVAQIKAGDLIAQSILFTVLTVARKDEARLAQWSEFDLDAGLWTVPAIRMKGNAEHVVPLSEQVVALLRSIPQTSAFVFAGKGKSGTIGTTAADDRMEAMGLRGTATLHGFRSSFADYAEDNLVGAGFTREDKERCLAHLVGSKVERAYTRTNAVEKRRQLMQAWANFATGTKAANVVRLAA